MRRVSDYLSIDDALDSLLATPVLTFRGEVVSIDSADPFRYKLGDIVVDSKTQNEYVMVGEPNKWELIGSALPSDCSINDRCTEDDVEIELKETKCTRCGAPIKIKSKYDSSVKCEYCGSEYSITRR